MKYASIDIGTNTVLLLVADFKDGRLHDICDLAHITRLGEGLKSTGVLSREAMDRTFAALARYKAEALEQGAEEFFCVGTAAMREAGNSADFVKRVRDSLGITIRIISGREEAYYTWLSVRHDRLSRTSRFIVIDVGGGSTEVIEGNDIGFMDFISLPVGSVKLTEMFIKNDPPKEDETSRLTAFLKETINLPFDGRGCTLVGTAGTATSLAAIAMGLETFEKKAVHGLAMPVETIERLIREMGSMNLEERKKLKGMEPGRADILLQGIILIREIMACLNVTELVVSANGGRYGVLYEELKGREG
ncbi:MAG TPA: Ppx/GppA phosphatase family protein [Syntrophorhabdaceae bacterium]|jgi:exopolyphosphatase/guanosine-5'-triphosphate,3'-diphosphate pyrophosphatase